MKRHFIFLASLLMTASFLCGQHAFAPYSSGNLFTLDLNDPSNTSYVGATPGAVGASDFGPDNEYYVMCGLDNGLYRIDTTNGSWTLMGAVAPPSGQTWSGMACDPTDGTMYICSSGGSGSSFFIIDPSNSATTFIGSNSVDNGVVGIAFDISGQMYAIYLVGKFYKIDKSDATATFVSDLVSAVATTPYHGLDYDYVSQTMYLISYNASSGDNELWTIDPVSGLNTLVGTVAEYSGSFGISPANDFVAHFSADMKDVCAGEVVHFTDQSIGDPESWLWTFEGGTPSSSAEQNPVVMYETAGTYDVALEITAGTSVNTSTLTDFISVQEVPAPVVIGSAGVCEGDITDYSTADNAGSSYDWEVEGGIITGGGGTHQITVEWGGPGIGQVIVTEDNGTCTGFSEPFEVIIEECTSVEESGRCDLVVRPNPAKSFLQVQWPDAGRATLQIIDATGQLVLTKDIQPAGGNNLTIETGSLKPGIYYLRVDMDGKRVMTSKFVKSSE